MTASKRPVCDCPEPCACYTKGYAAGVEMASAQPTFNDPAEHSAADLPPHVAIDNIRAAAQRAIRQAMGEDYDPDADEIAQKSSDLVAQLLIENTRDPKNWLADVANLVAEAASVGEEVGLDLTQVKEGQGEQ